MAGRLDGHVDGRPVSLVAEDRDLTLGGSTVGTLLALRRGWLAAFQPLRGVLGWAKIRVLVRVPWLGNVEVFPRPNYLVRLILPRA